MIEFKAGIFFSTLFCCLSIIIPLATSLSFNFSFRHQAGLSSEIQLEGVATWNSTDGIDLTNDTVTHGVGRAVYEEPLLITNDFTTQISFFVDSSDPNRSNGGLSFFLLPYPFNSSSGGSHGSSSPGVTVEFDVFQNNTGNSCSSHVGINFKSIKSKHITLRTCVKDGSQATARVSYNASTHNLNVVLNYLDAQVSSGPPSLNSTINLADVLPDKVAIGFSAAAGVVTEICRILSWSFNSSSPPNTAGGGNRRVLILVIGAVVLVAVLGNLLLWFFLWRDKNPRRNALDRQQTIGDELDEGKGPQRFPYEVLASAASNFYEEGKLGRGGSASVYKAYLVDLKCEVAIKRIFSGPEVEQQRKVYISEVKIISRLRHRNLVKLEGWCHHRGECLLVYEFMPNGSLDSYLYSTDKILEWPVRYRIALGLADALLYLHEGCDQCVLHRDIKPSNIMLDSAFNAKLGDFGLARLVDHDHDLKTTKVAGTFGYFAPEYYTTGKASKESDVYSFGIVALEIACGRRSVDHREQPSKEVLVEWVRELHGRRTILDAADPKLNGNFDEEEMECLLIVGLWCALPDRKLRPSIRQAINALKLETPLPDHLPPQMPLPGALAMV